MIYRVWVFYFSMKSICDLFSMYDESRPFCEPRAGVQFFCTIMGVDGLKKHLTPLRAVANIYNFFCQIRIGVDISCWVYPQDASEHVMTEFLEEDSFTTLIKVLMSWLKKMLAHKLIPVVVLDGQSLLQKKSHS